MINDTDVFLVTRHRKDYQVTAAELYEYVNAPEVACVSADVTGIMANPSKNLYWIYLIEPTNDLMKILEPYWDLSERRWVRVPISWINEAGERVRIPTDVMRERGSSSLRITWVEDDFDYIGEHYANTGYGEILDVGPMEIGRDCKI